MKFPFTVYTAHHGYAWSNIPEGFSEDSLKKFEQIVTSSKPEYMNDGERFEGIIYAQAHIAVFSAMRVPNWDYSNRTSLYYAFAFLPRLEGKRINIDQLLRSPEFTIPTKNPKPEIEYVGGPSVSAPAAVIDDFKSGTPMIQSVDFSYCGDLLCEIGNVAEKWWMFRTIGTSSDHARVEFEKNAFYFSMHNERRESSRVSHVDGVDAQFASRRDQRVISLEDDRSADQMSRLEIKFAAALKTVRRERDADAMAIVVLSAKVSKLSAVVGIVVAINLLLLVYLFRTPIANLLSGFNIEIEQPKVEQKQEKKTVHEISGANASVGSVATNMISKVTNKVEKLDAAKDGAAKSKIKNRK